MIEPGITTRDLDYEADRMIVDAGAYPTFKGYHGYPSSICASINDEVVHGIPSKRKLREGDIVGIDCGATYLGYVGDAAVTVPSGMSSDAGQPAAGSHAAIALREPSGDARSGTGSAMCATPFRLMLSRLDIRLLRTTAGTASDGPCTKSRRFPTTASRERARPARRMGHCN